MVTYSDLFAFVTMLVMVITLVVYITEKKIEFGFAGFPAQAQEPKALPFFARRIKCTKCIFGFRGIPTDIPEVRNNRPGLVI